MGTQIENVDLEIRIIEFLSSVVSGSHEYQLPIEKGQMNDFKRFLN